MMTRGKSTVNVAPAASPVSGTRPQKRPDKSTKGSKGAPRSKRAKTSAPSATAVTQDSGHLLPHDEHPSQLQRVPLSNAPLPPLQQSAPLKDLAAIISGAVMAPCYFHMLFSFKTVGFTCSYDTHGMIISQRVFSPLYFLFLLFFPEVLS